MFDGTVLGRALQGAHYRFVWDGKNVKSIYDFSNGETILRDDLLAAKSGKKPLNNAIAAAGGTGHARRRRNALLFRDRPRQLSRLCARDVLRFPPTWQACGSCAEDDEHAALLQEKGIEHERAYLERLRKKGRSIAEIPSEGTLEARVSATRAAMRAGADVVYQGALFAAPWHGFSDFLLRVNGVPSSLGDFAYDVADTKLARTAKPKHVVQLCVYADLLGAIQGIEPPRMHVVLGDGTEVSLRTSTVRHYYGVARRRFELFVAAPPATARRAVWSLRVLPMETTVRGRMGGDRTP